MRPQSANARAALALVDELSRLGVRDVCISPGSRSTALVTAVLKTVSMRPRVILDERSSAFFALGLARASARPVLVLCTSGTAAANFYPAVVEANLSHVPLILLTADRPIELQDCHAPQTIDQRRLYGVHVRLSLELAAPDDMDDLEEYFRTIAARAVDGALGMPPGPVHINFPMREPLIDVNEERQALLAASAAMHDSAGENRTLFPRTTILTSVPSPTADSLHTLAHLLKAPLRGLIVCGPGTIPNGADPKLVCSAIARLAERLEWPILADPLSGLRFGRHDLSRVIDAHDLLTRDHELARTLAPEAVIHFGRPLTSKVTNEMLARQKPLAFYLMVAPWGSWPDPYRLATFVVRAWPDTICLGLLAHEQLCAAGQDWLARWKLAASAARRELTHQISACEELFEGRLFAELVPLLPDGSTLYVGNSMPVRDLDAFAPSIEREIHVFGNRGANGIDGVLSSAAGASAATQAATVLVVGDLSFLHDLSGTIAALRHAHNLTVIVLNNDGGAIFSFLPQAALGEHFVPYFVTPHGLSDLSPVAHLVGASWHRVASWDEFRLVFKDSLIRPGLKFIELKTDRDQNVVLHRTFMERACLASRSSLERAGLLGD